MLLCWWFVEFDELFGLTLPNEFWVGELPVPMGKQKKLLRKSVDNKIIVVEKI